jgi:Chaperone of endosialidase
MHPENALAMGCARVALVGSCLISACHPGASTSAPSVDAGPAGHDAGAHDAGTHDAGTHDGGARDGGGACVCSGPRPLVANVVCADGSIGGPVCTSDSAGGCSWQIRNCPLDAGVADAGPVACQPSECGDSTQCPPAESCDEIPTTGPCVTKRCCPALGCNPMCPDGVMKDAKGCGTCQCVSAASCQLDSDCPALGVCNPCTNAGGACADRKCVGGACQWVCPSCGTVSCGSDEVCCDHCASRCRSKSYAGPDACPDEVNPNRACADAGAGCAQSGQSCSSTPCCSGLQCCSGQPFPPGTAQCRGGPGCPISDRNMKADIVPVKPEHVLQGLLALPIAHWHYKSDTPEVQHIGPMAQDFKATFGVGVDDKHIFQIDADGVSFAAIQALDHKLEALAAGQRALQQENRKLHAELRRLRAQEPGQPSGGIERRAPAAK